MLPVGFMENLKCLTISFLNFIEIKVVKNVFICVLRPEHSYKNIAIMQLFGFEAAILSQF